MTSDVFFEFLTKDDWKRIYAASPFQEILILVDELEVKYSSGKDLLRVFQLSEFLLVEFIPFHH